MHHHIARWALSLTLAAASGCTEATAPHSALGFAQVSAGGFLTCGITPGGAAYCWGANRLGELGNGSSDTIAHSMPAAVSGGLSFAAVSAARDFACGVTTGGAAYCWGGNYLGQLGDGSTTDRSAPVPASGGLTFTAVSSGFSHTCGLTTGGAAYCWGDNGYGQLGNGSTTNSSAPVPVSGGLTFTAVSSGQFHSCGLTPGGAAYCWGDNSEGQLGSDSADTIPHTMPVAVTGGLTFTAVSSGEYHSCGLTTGGAGYCWGDGYWGQLGDGVKLDPYLPRGATTPVAVSGGLTFAAISAGWQHSCGVTTGGAAYCWGASEALGSGMINTEAVTAPVPVSGGLTFTALSSGWSHSCGLTTGGTAYCWGSNFDGELGDGSTNFGSVPVRVGGQP